MPIASHIQRFTPVLVAALLVVGVSHAQRGQQTVPVGPIPQPTQPNFDDEVQIWQGRVIRVEGGDRLILKVEGERESFAVAENARIRKDRRQAELDSLTRGDFATLHTVSRGEREVAVHVRAFSLR